MFETNKKTGSAGIKLVAAVALSGALALALCACGSSPTRGVQNSSNAASNTASTTSTPVADGEFATMGEVFESVEGLASWTYDETKFTYSTNDGVKYYLVEAELEPGMKEKIDEAEFDNNKIKEILRNVPVTRQEVYEAPSQEELTALAGKTGLELAQIGYEFMTGTLTVNGEQTDVLATKAPFTYLITFAGKVIDENADAAEAVKDMTVDNVAVQDIDGNLLG